MEMKHISISLLLVFFTIAFTSCSKKEYIDCIPVESTAVISLDVAKLMSNSSEKRLPFLDKIIGKESGDRTGIDAGEKIYLFENNDGLLGLCASVQSADKITELIKDKLLPDGTCTAIMKKDGVSITTVYQNWLFAYDDDALIVAGPFVEQEKAQLQRRVMRWFKADEDASIRNSKLYETLETMSAPISMVARSHALPETLTSMFSLGMPSSVDPSQIIVAAEMTPSDDEIISVDISTFSYNEKLNRQMEKSKANFRPAKASLINKIYLSDMSVMMNVKGENLLNMLRQRKEFQSMLAGINTAIDIDNILRSFDGEVIMTTKETSDATDFTLYAETVSIKWLADVDYWKRSCPSGTSITTIGNNVFDYQFDRNNSSGRHFFFGLTDANRFLGTTDIECKALFTTDKGSDSIADNSKYLNILSARNDSRMVLVYHLDSAVEKLETPLKEVLSDVIASFFGNARTVVATIS